jgi:hypothetical protein
VWITARNEYIARSDGVFHCPECSEEFEAARNLRLHYHIQHAPTESITTDDPSSPTKRPRGSLSPLQKKRARFGQMVNDDEVDDSEDEAGEMDDGMGDEGGAVAGLEQQFKQLITGHEHSAQELIRPPELAAAHVAIEPKWHITICEECGYAVPRSMLAYHFKKMHGRSKVLPSNLDAVLDSHGVIERAEQPDTVVAPLQSIPIVAGVQCDVQGCNYVTKSVRTIANHIYSKHKGTGQEKIKHCNVQCVYHTKTEYWAVEENYSTFSGDHSDIIEHLEQIKELDRQGLNTGHFQKPALERLVTPFMATFRWADITDGKEGNKLLQLVSVPKDNDDLANLSFINGSYFAGIAPVMHRFNPIALQWINTPKG